MASCSLVVLATTRLEVPDGRCIATRAGGPASPAVCPARRHRRFSARLGHRELPPLRQVELRLRAARSPGPRAAAPVDPVGGRWQDHRASAGGPGAGESAPGTGRLPGVHRSERADRGGQRGDLRGQRAVPTGRGRSPAADGGKRGLYAQLQAEFAAEVARLAGQAARSLGGARGGDGLAAVKLAIRTAPRGCRACGYRLVAAA